MPDSLLFRAIDLKDPKGLAIKLKNSPDALSKYLRDKFSEQTMALLNSHEGSLPDSNLIANDLAKEFNNLLSSYDFYNQQRFSGITLPKEIKKEIKKLEKGNLHDRNLIRLNRILLCKAYPDEIWENRYYHINAVKEFFDEFKETENFAILSNNFVAFDPDTDIVYKDWLRELEQNHAYFNNLCKQTTEKQQNMLVELNLEGYKTAYFSMKTEWRFIPGLGTAHINEAGMALDHVYGLPYLNGSGCKGIMRQYVLEHLLDPDGNTNLNDIDTLLMDEELKMILEKEDTCALEQDIQKWIEKNNRYNFSDQPIQKLITDAEYKETIRTVMHIFGSQEAAGKVIFLDAYPEKLRTSASILNPHYNFYYAGPKWPGDDEERLIPKKFLTIEDADFAFGLASKKKELLLIAVAWLKEALQKTGAGAKTAVDYGYFSGYKDLVPLIDNKVFLIEKKVSRKKMSPLERMIEDINELPLKEIKTLIKEYFDKYRVELDKDTRVLAEGAITSKLVTEIKSYYDEDFDQFIVVTVLENLPESMASELARALIRLKRFQAEKINEKLMKFIPSEQNDSQINEVLDLLQKKDPNKIKQGLPKARKILEDPEISAEIKKSIAKTIMSIKQTKAIKKKMLEKIKDKAKQYQ